MILRNVRTIREPVRGHPNQSDLVLCALMANIRQYGGLASLDTHTAHSDCDFEMEGLRLVVTAFTLLDWHPEALIGS